MTSRSLQITRANPKTWIMAAAGLALAGIIVGVAIIAGGSAARALNGVGAIVWIASGVVLALSLPAAQRRALGWVAAIGSGLILGGIVRPGTLPEAIVSFSIAGAAVVLLAGDRTGGWALLAPAIYLPVHLIIGIGRAMMRGSIRTGPPPTAAILPLVMILAAAAAGLLAAWVVRRNQ